MSAASARDRRNRPRLPAWPHSSPWETVDGRDRRVPQPASACSLGLRSGSKRQLFQDLASTPPPRPASTRQRSWPASSQREKLGTTGIGEGIAIPHARVQAARPADRVLRPAGDAGRLRRAGRCAGRSGLPAAGARGGEHRAAQGAGPDRPSAPRSGGLRRGCAAKPSPTAVYDLLRRPGAGQRRLSRAPAGDASAPARLRGGVVRPRRPAARRPREPASPRWWLELLAAGAYLVADDLVRLERRATAALPRRPPARRA